MKIVIVSHTIYPKTTPRGIRATELAKELCRQGNQVVLCGVLGKFDYSDFERRFKVKIKNLGPTKFVKINSDPDVTIKTNLLHRLLNKFLRKPIEFPDIELMFRTYQLLRKENNIDLLITIAGPFTLNWGAALYKTFNVNKFAKKWIADCGDPYMGNPFHKPAGYFKYVEKWFCKKTDFITVPIEQAKAAYYSEFHNKIKVIPQGFDFSLDSANKEQMNSVLTFIYAGTFYTHRDPRPFLDYLLSKETDFKFIIYTENAALIKTYVDKFGRKLEVKKYIPREDLIKEMKKADFLVNFENIANVQSPSKLIDYAITRRPILSLNQINLDYKKIDQFLNKNYINQLLIENLEQYHISNVACNFLKLL